RSAACDFEDVAAQLRHRHQHIDVGIVQRLLRVVRRLEHRLNGWICGWHTQDDGIAGPGWRHETRLKPRSYFSKAHRSKIEKLTDLALERNLEITLACACRQRRPQRHEHLPKTRETLNGHPILHDSAPTASTPNKGNAMAIPGVSRRLAGYLHENGLNRRNCRVTGALLSRADFVVGNRIP